MANNRNDYSMFPLPDESMSVTSNFGWDCKDSSKFLASLLNMKTIGILTSSVPSPDIENKGLLVAVVPLLLSTTIPPFAPDFSKIRAFSKSSYLRKMLI